MLRLGVVRLFSLGSLMKREPCDLRHKARSCTHTPVKDASRHKSCSPLFCDLTSLDLGTGLALDSSCRHSCRLRILASRARQALVDHDPHITFFISLVFRFHRESRLTGGSGLRRRHRRNIQKRPALHCLVARRTRAAQRKSNAKRPPRGAKIKGGCCGGRRYR